MPVWLTYVDESYDDSLFCLSAMLIRHTEWAECFRKIKAFRKEIKEEFEVPISYEIHSHEFVAGRGRPSKRIITKWERSRIFHRSLGLVASLPRVHLFNVCLEKRGRQHPQVDAWDRLTNRVERTMVEFERREIKLRKDLLAKLGSNALDGVELSFLRVRLEDYKSTALFIADEGHEQEITRALRKMRVVNFIPSKYGSWGDGSRAKNLTTEHIIEDPVFKPSNRSYFIQLADCVAFSLLKRETKPTANVLKYRLDKMFEDCCRGICYKKAALNDPLGIVRK